MSEMKNSVVCIDANLIVWSLLPYPQSDTADALLRSWRARKIQLVAPTLLSFEITSTLHRLVHLREITAEAGEAAFQQFLNIPIRLYYRQEILTTAWLFAKQFNRPRAYDTAYLAVAQMHNCEFWTGDRRLYNAVHHQLSWLRWIGEEQG